MNLEDYFDFLGPNDIRLKGHRIGIESILYENVHRAQTPEEMAIRFPTLSLEQIYATILYYLQNKEKVEAYLTQWLEHEDRMFEEQHRNPTPAMQRLSQIKAERKIEGQEITKSQAA